MKTLVSVTAGLFAFGLAASAHEVDLPNGHLTPTANYGFEVVGRDTLAGVFDGLYTDVWSHGGYAYVGTFQEPDCTRAGVFVVDIQQAIANYGTAIEGAVVAEIKSAPNTRVNDVKVHTITFKNQTRDVLVATEEQCGGVTGSGKKQLGKGGISFYDVTNPSRPHAIKQHAISQNGIHNTFIWTDDSGTSYGIAVDNVDVNDVIIMDLTRPQSPKEIGRIGIGDWLNGASYPQIADDNQLFTGVFAAPLLHDVWVMQVGGEWQAVLSYWDAGFVVINVDDPANPYVLGDTTYPDPDPIFGVSPGEGNAHAAVFGGDEGQYIFAGDEDFDPFRTQVISDAGVGHLATQGSDTPLLVGGDSIAEVGTYVGLACAPIPAGDGIAVIQRGSCAFTTKVGNAEAAGYKAAVVFNSSGGCGASVSMLVEGGIPALFIPRPAGFEVLGLAAQYDPATCDGINPDNGDALLSGFEGTGVGVVTVEASFDGWGYFHMTNNLPGGTTTLAPPSVPGESPANRDVLDIPYLGHMGYFAPIEATDPSFAVGKGDLTMHNVEGDPLTADATPTFDSGPRAFISWYSAGMRAVEYRPGHWHTGNGGVWSWNVHEVGQFIAEDGSNFWGVHVDTAMIEGEETQIILGSDRNTGLWIFTFDCIDRLLDENGQDTGLYCRRNP